jgi:hypothetical protein
MVKLCGYYLDGCQKKIDKVATYGLDHIMLNQITNLYDVSNETRINMKIKTNIHN